MEVDVVIVGSGIGGLTAGAMLAKKGKQVVILEKQKHFGGAIRRFNRNRVSFDVGFHYTGCLGDGEILDILWRYCGVRSDIDVVSAGRTGYDQFDFFDGAESIRGYFSYPQFAGELKHHFPAEKEGIDRYFKEIRDICSEVPFYNTDLPLTPFLRGYKSRPRSLAEFLRSITDNNRLRSVLAAPAFLYGVPVEKCALETHALVAHGYYTGAYTVRGGGQAIVDAFLASLARMGVEMVAGCEATSILVDNSRVAGVETSAGERIACRELIFTGHPANLPAMVPATVFRPAYRTRLQTLENSLSMFVVFGRAEKNVDEQKDGLNYYLLPAKGEVLPASGTTPPHLRPMMLTSTGGGHGESLRSAANGIILLRLGYWRDVEEFSASRRGERPGRYERYKAAVADGMLTSAAERWGHLTGEITPLAVGTPLTFQDELAAPEGCAYGAMHCLDQFNPDVRTRLPGLYLCGQSTLMTGVVGASISGLVGVGEIVGLEQFWRNLQEWR